MLPGHKSLNTGLRSGNAAAEAYNLTSGTLFSRFTGGKNRFFCNIFHQKKKGEGLSTSTPTFLISFLESGEDFPRQQALSKTNRRQRAGPLKIPS